METPSSLSYSQAPVKLDLFWACISSEKLGIWHVRRPVLRDRRMLIMERGAVKSALHQSCCIFTTNILNRVL